MPGRAPAGYNLVTKPRKEVEIMKKILAAAALTALLTAQAAAASPAGSLTVNGDPVEAAGSYVHQNTTYVPLRAVAEALRPDAVVAWETDRAAIRADGLEVTARPGDTYIRSNGRTLAVPHGVHLSAGRTLVPVRVLAEAMGAKGLRATTREEFAAALKEALASKMPVVIDCIINCDDKVWPMVAPGTPISDCFSGEDLKAKAQ